MTIIDYKTFNVTGKLHHFNYYGSSVGVLAAGERSILKLSSTLTLTKALILDHATDAYQETSLEVVSGFGYTHIYFTTSYQVGPNHLLGLFKLSTSLNIISEHHIITTDELVRCFISDGNRYLITTQATDNDRIVKRIPLIYNEKSFTVGGYPTADNLNTDVRTLIDDGDVVLTNIAASQSAFTAIPTNQSLTITPTNISNSVAKAYGVDPYFADSILAFRKVGTTSAGFQIINEPFCIFGNTDATTDSATIVVSGGASYSSTNNQVTIPNLDSNSSFPVLHTQDFGYLPLANPSKQIGMYKVWGYKCETGNDCILDRITTLNQTCGNDVYELGEECDVGPDDNTDGCTSQCKLTASHECTNTVGSITTCDEIVCGDGKIEKHEHCDDNDNFDAAGCTKGCKAGSPETGYMCGNHLYLTVNSHCFQNCGDGTLDTGEECDDGNSSFLGCSVCMAEEHYTCNGAGDLCTPTCGDGFERLPETCDDGGTTDGDGCSASCQEEEDYTCSGDPSLCFKLCGNGE